MTNNRNSKTKPKPPQTPSSALSDPPPLAAASPPTLSETTQIFHRERPRCNVFQTIKDDDDDDFGGPVSAHFVRPDRLSDSGVLEDITMDSMAFSLHYQSLAGSDSGDIKTRQFVRLGTPSSQGSYMELTEATKRPAEVVLDANSAGKDSNDMSIEVDHQMSFGYDIPSPAFDAAAAILAEEGAPKESPHHSLEGSVVSPVTHLHQIQPSDSSIKENKEFNVGVIEIMPVCRQLDFDNGNRGTPLRVDEDKGMVSDTDHKSDQVIQNPIHRFTPLSLSGRKQLVMRSPDSSRHDGNITQPLVQSGLFVPEVHVAHGATPSSVHISILKMKTLEATPAISVLKEGMDRLKARLSKFSPGFSLSNKKYCEYKHDETRQTPLGEKLFSLTPDSNVYKGLVDGNEHGIQSNKNICKSSQNEETLDAKIDEENLSLISAHVSYNDENPKVVEMGASPSQMTHLTKVVDVDLADRTVEKGKDEILVPSPPIQEVTPQLCSLQDPPSMQDLSPKGNLDGHGLDNSYHSVLQVAQSHLTKSGISISSGKKLQDSPNMQNLSPKSNLDGHDNSYHSVLQVAQSPLTKSGISISSGKKLQDSPNMQNLSTKSNLYGHGLDNSYHSVLQVAQSPLTKSGISISSGKKLQDSPNVQDLSPKSNLDGHGLHNSYHSALQVAQSPLTKSGINISSGKKRKGVEIRSNGDNIDKIGRIGRSPEVHKSGNGDLQLLSEQTGSMRSEREKLGDQTLNDGDLILKKFLARTNQLLPPSVDKLNLRSISRLEDILVHLHKVKKKESLCSEIQSQLKITDPLNILRDKRVAETRTLLYDIAYEKAKLQLLHVKHDKLQKKVQQVSSGLQECETIKLNSIPSSSKSGAMDTQADDSRWQGKCRVSSQKVLEKKQELEILESKAKSWSEFLHSHCMMEGYQSYTNTIKAVSGYLQQRKSCKSIRQNLKLWEIEDFERKDGCYKVCLNYCGYLTQRFTVNTGQSSIIISNSLNDVNIGKTFPNLDGISAFVFVLHPHTTKKCTGSSIMARETQITSSLVSNLLDVVEEVQSAQIEFRNLVAAKFYSHSVQCLDLQLSFIDFCSGRRVEVTFDITCLKCGVYPAEVLPSQIHDPSSGEQKSLPSSLLDEIRTAAESVRVGYSRIIRLCRCISQVVQASTKSR
ncbi:uncharacterized protein LOC114403623 isoform X3 [Glycine soja]|uniref:uncharacterized protein LOC114403623 isoform X3 n=1 Tax=Glycine soja TaxID=3848 RepID=UPI00103CC44A|nr:uncharacterized protein LOC114403623 isoform X3 [Glycine soja]